MRFSIPIILGTARKERESEKVFNYVVTRARALDSLDIVPVDTRDFVLGNTVPSWEEGNAVADKWRSIAKEAHGFIVVSPEYNHGYPGELKMLLDSAYEEYTGKPLGIVSVSNGSFGGVRMTEQLKQVSIKMGMIPLRDTVPVPKVEEAFLPDGNPVDASFEKRVDTFLDAFVSAVKLLKHGI